MGMPIVVDVRDVDDEAALEPIFDWFRWVDETFSTYRADSEVSRLNRAELALADASPEVREVLARCDELRAETSGYFDVHAASDDILDPSGLVKGWSVDRAATIADDLGWRNYAINAGGDMRLCGGALPAPLWRVGIQHPHERQQVVAVVAGDDLAVRDLDTSGQVVSLYEPTEVAVLSRSGGFAFVRPTGGPLKDKTFVTRAKLTKPAAK